MNAAEQIDRIRYMESKERFYAAEIDGRPARDHDEALPCYAVQDLARDLTRLFDDLCRLDNDIHDGYHAGGEFDDRIAASMLALFGKWVGLADRVLVRVEDLERLDYDVDEATEFRRVLREARAMVGPEPEALTDAGAACRDAAVEEFRAGRRLSILRL